MGSIHDKIKNDRKDKNKKVTSEKVKKYEGIKLKNDFGVNCVKPFFEKKIILATDYKCGLLDYNCGYALLSVYDIYKLKNINDSFYLAFKIQNNIKILKYNYINKTTTDTTDIGMFEWAIKIKYFYSEIHNKEYLFILQYKELNIYLIKDDITYDKIYDFKKKGF